MEVPESRPDILPQRKFQPGPVPPVSNGGPVQKPTVPPTYQPPPPQSIQPQSIQPSLSPRQEPFHPLSVQQQKQKYQKPSSNLPRLQIPSSSSSINQNAPQTSIPFGQIPLLNPFIVQPGMFKSPEQYERNSFIKNDNFSG